VVIAMGTKLVQNPSLLPCACLMVARINPLQIVPSRSLAHCVTRFHHGLHLNLARRSPRVTFYAARYGVDTLGGRVYIRPFRESKMEIPDQMAILFILTSTFLVIKRAVARCLSGPGEPAVAGRALNCSRAL
jgi:hypothetical protein